MVPLMLGLGAAAIALRPLKEEERQQRGVFQDPKTGYAFQAPPGVKPLRDDQGELAFRLWSFTPWPVDAELEGPRVQVEVGPLGEEQRTTYVFPLLLKEYGLASEVVQVSVPRPVGAVVEEVASDKGEAKVPVVTGFKRGSEGERRAKLARLQGAKDTLLPGDILRGFTTTQLLYSPGSQMGLSLPKRCRGMFGADKQRIEDIRSALNMGKEQDGPVTYVVERRSDEG